MTDHPPAIPARPLHDRIRLCPNCVKRQTYVTLCPEHSMRLAFGFTKQTGLSPEQPARIGGHDE